MSAIVVARAGGRPAVRRRASRDSRIRHGSSRRAFAEIGKVVGSVKRIFFCGRLDGLAFNAYCSITVVHAPPAHRVLNMFFAIEAANGVPIFEQIIRQIKFAIAGGALKAGDRVPSVRELARELAINPNTVARAYRDLQSESILDTVRGLGLEVASGALERCRSQRQKIVRERLRQVLLEAKQSRLELGDLRALIDKELASLYRDEK